MEVEDHDTNLSDFDGAHGACIACLYEDELDSDGLCASCQPIDEEHRRVLVNLLKQPKEATASENT